MPATSAFRCYQPLTHWLQGGGVSTYAWIACTYLHEEDGVEDDKRFGQSARDVGILVETKHPGPRRHRHGLDALHVAPVGVLVVVVDAGVDSFLVERVVRVENLI